MTSRARALDSNGSVASRDLLAIWVMAVAVAAGGLALIYRSVLNEDVPQSEAFHEYNAVRVQSFAEQIAQGALGVVMLGDSRLRYATATEDELSAELSQRMGTKVVVLRLVNNWAVFSDFETLAPMIESAEPAIVVIQNELRFKDRADDASALLRREYLLWRAFGSDAWNPGNVDQTSLQQEMRCEVLFNESVEARRERVFQWVEFNPNGQNSSKVSDFARRLEIAGISVEYLEVPITTEAEAGLPGIEPADGASGLGAAVDIADSDFCDVVHMNPRGRQQYTGWLVSALGDEFGPKELAR